MSRMTNDVTTIEGVITDVPATLLQQSIRLVGGIIIVIVMNWKLTFMILVLAPIMVLFAKTFGKKLKNLSREIQDKLADLHNHHRGKHQRHGTGQILRPSGTGNRAF